MIRDKTAIVGLGATPYYRRGASAPQTLEELVGSGYLQRKIENYAAQLDVLLERILQRTRQ